MTTELEKTFFDTFGIEPYDRYYNCKLNLEGECKPEKSCCACEHSEDVYCYPQITDRHYLELICVLNKYFADAYQCCSMFASQTIEEIKNDILKELLEIIEQHRQLVEDEDLEDIERCNKLKHQVQAIFKGER